MSVNEVDMAFGWRIRVEPVEPATLNLKHGRGSSYGRQSSYAREGAGRRGCLSSGQDSYESGVGQNLDFYA